jgi:nucleoid-associated protein YgaU
VKGTHFVRKGESASSLAKKYYNNPNDSSLIKDFNPTIKMGNMIFIPYNR